MTDRKPTIRVLCVDDSALMRGLLTAIINDAPDMEVVATAPDPLVARELIKRHDPDVLTLDVEMPRMDGLDFLERLMRLRPMPVVMISSLTKKNSETTFRALEMGAVDFVAKPTVGIRDGVTNAAEDIVDRIRAAASVTCHKRRRERESAPSELAPMSANMPVSRDRLVVVGASTGGVDALRDLLVPMPVNAPPIVITQHMPAGFTRAFANRLNGMATVAICEAEHGTRVQPGHAYIAPGGDQHMAVVRHNGGYRIELCAGEPVNRHRPSVDVLFASAARHAGARAIGILLTGMGRDGADGLLQMRRAGAATLAQDEATSVVFGMPRAAIANGAAEQVVSIHDMSARAMALAADPERVVAVS